MLEHNFERAIAALAPGRRVTVVIRGKARSLPAAPQPAPVAAPDPLEIAARQLLERDVETRSAVAALTERVGDSVRDVGAAIGTIAAGQIELAQQVKELAGTLHLPVRPVYDASGKIIGAQRVARTGG